MQIDRDDTPITQLGTRILLTTLDVETRRDERPGAKVDAIRWELQRRQLRRIATATTILALVLTAWAIAGFFVHINSNTPPPFGGRYR